MLGKLAVVASFFAMGFGLRFYNVPVFSDLLANTLIPIIRPIVNAITPHIQGIITFLKQNSQASVTLFISGCTLTGFLVNYVKNRQMLKMQQEAIEQQREFATLQNQFINAGSVNTQLQTTRSELEMQVQNQSEKLKLFENFLSDQQDVKKDLRLELDTRVDQLHGDINYVLNKLKELENKRVPTYVP